jgi:CubicO group peptidase (beta-lactamase class C family)
VRFISCLFLFAFFLSCNSGPKKALTNIDSAGANGYVNRDYLLKKITAKDSALKAFRLDTLFDRIAKEKAINGNVLIAQGNTILYQRSMGFLNNDLQIPLTQNSLFQLASVSKTLTATLILKLHARKLLNVQDKITKYIPKWPYVEMTMHHLLCHRSGLKSYTNIISDSLKSNDDKKYSNQAVIDFFIRNKPDLEFKVDERFNYCNTNYVLLASIAEMAANQKFYTLLKHHVLNPSGMHHTYLRDSVAKEDKKHITVAHYNNYELLNDDYFENVIGDKGIYSSTGDLFLFSKALYTNVLLNTTLLNEMQSSHSPERKFGTYGYGWRLFSDSLKLDKKFVYHNGWWHGYRNAFHRRLDDEITIIVLSNRLNRAVYNVDAIFNAIDGIVPPLSEEALIDVYKEE